MTYKLNKQAFVECFSSLVNIHENCTSFLLLGDAYMRIQLPEKAVHSYLEAYNRSHENLSIAKKIGHAFFCSHKLRTAKDFYKKVLKQHPQGIEICLELAKIYLKLSEYDSALQTISKLNDVHELKSKINTMKDQNENLILTAKIYGLKGCREKEINFWKKAKNMCMNIIAKESKLGKNEIQPYSDITINVVENLANCVIEEGNFIEADEYFKSALSLIPNNKTIFKLIVTNLLRQNKVNDCQSYFESLRKLPKVDSDVYLILARTLTAQSRLEDAVNILRDAVKSDPYNYHLLCDYISLMWRLDRLDEIKTLIRQSNHDVNRSSICSGLKFSQVSWIILAFVFMLEFDLETFCLIKRILSFRLKRDYCFDTREDIGNHYNVSILHVVIWNGENSPSLI